MVSALGFLDEETILAHGFAMRHKITSFTIPVIGEHHIYNHIYLAAPDKNRDIILCALMMPQTFEWPSMHLYQINGWTMQTKIECSFFPRTGEARDTLYSDAILSKPSRTGIFTSDEIGKRIIHKPNEKPQFDKGVDYDFASNCFDTLLKAMEEAEASHEIQKEEADNPEFCTLNKAMRKKFRGYVHRFMSS